MTIILRGATLIDGTGADPVRSGTVVLTDDRIESVGEDVGATQGAEVYDLEGLTLLPGLIDAHTHLGSQRLNAADQTLAEVAAGIFKNCELALDAGFTTCRELGGVDGGVVQAIERGVIRGPRILPSAFTCQTGGHGDLSPPYTPQSYHDHLPHCAGLYQNWTPADGPDNIRTSLRSQFKNGAKQVKLCVTGGVVSLHDSLEDTQYTVEELRAAVIEAKSRNTYVTAHTHNNQGIRNGLEAGIECFEHGTAIDEEIADMMAKAGAAHVPTLAVAHTFVEEFKNWGLPDAVLPRIQGVEDGMANAAKLTTDAGCLVGSGSDLIGPNQVRRGLELVLRSRIHDPMHAIVTATSVNAKVLRFLQVGSVTPGLLADVIAVSGDPLTEPELFDDPDRVVLVIKGGVVQKDTRVTA